MYRLPILVPGVVLGIVVLGAAGWEASGVYGGSSGASELAPVGEEWCMHSADKWFVATAAGSCSPTGYLDSTACEATTTHADYRIRVPFGEPGLQYVTVTWITGTSQEPAVDTAKLALQRGRLQRESDTWNCGAGKHNGPDATWVFVPDASGNVIVLNSSPYRVTFFTLPAEKEEAL